jgi:hypothetical protein
MAWVSGQIGKAGSLQNPEVNPDNKYGNFEDEKTWKEKQNKKITSI